MSMTLKEVVLVGRSIGLDVHRDFLRDRDRGWRSVLGLRAVSRRRLGRLKVLASKVCCLDDRVVLEATGNALAIAQDP